jgi:hypothetical protein
MIFIENQSVDWKELIKNISIQVEKELEENVNNYLNWLRDKNEELKIHIKGRLN